MRRDTIALLSTAAVVPLLAGCGSNGDDGTSAPTASETTTAQKSTSDASATDGTPTADPAPFRVFALADPSRLVVDVVDESAD